MLLLIMASVITLTLMFSHFNRMDKYNKVREQVIYVGDQQPQYIDETNQKLKELLGDKGFNNINVSSKDETIQGNTYRTIFVRCTTKFLTYSTEIQVRHTVKYGDEGEV